MVGIGVCFSYRPAFDPPRVVADIASHAVTFTMDDSADLVLHSRPRLGLLSAATTFSGLPLDTTGVGTLLRWSEGPTTLSRDTVLRPVLQSFIVDTTCLVTLEKRPDKRIELIVRRDSVSVCAFHAAVLYSRTERGLRTAREVSDTIPYTRSLNLLLVDSMNALQWRSLRVRRIAFKTSEFGKVQSAIRSGTVKFPDYGTKEFSLLPGANILLDSLKGELLELSVRDSIRAVFRGTAKQLYADSNDLRPRASEEFRSKEWFVVVLGVLATLAGTLLPIADKLRAQKNDSAKQ